jgi:hypothetical protein
LDPKKTNLTPPFFFIKVPMPSQESELSWICVIGLSIFPLSIILLFDFGAVPTVWYCLLFLWLVWYEKEHTHSARSRLYFWVSDTSYSSYIFLQQPLEPLAVPSWNVDKVHKTRLLSRIWTTLRICRWQCCCVYCNVWRRTITM